MNAAEFLDRLRRTDPRHFQIAALASLLAYGLLQLHFEVSPLRVALLLWTALLTQWACSRFSGIAFDPRSALISGLSLCLLLRTNHALLAMLAALLAVGGKFVLRWRGKHVFNPTNFGIVALMLGGAPVWVSPGQWGSLAFFGFLLVCLGGLVVYRAARSDVTLAFIGFYGALVVLRSLQVGEPLAIPLHRLQSGALLIFSFFMISDPKTTPDARAGRILFALLVALGAAYVQFRLFRTNGVLWSLALFSLAVPLIDRLLPGERYLWHRPRRIRPALAPSGEPGIPRRAPVPVVPTPTQEYVMKRLIPALAVAVPLALAPGTVHAFCGLYVAKGDAKLFNQASQVVLVRDQNRTVMTMVSDFKGDPRDFAVVIPVPTFLKQGQIHVGDKALVDHLDAYSSPRLVEYFDSDPCQRMELSKAMSFDRMTLSASKAQSMARERSLGVTIEARYTVGEYDIIILSAKQSSGLETWLRENGYRIPDGASAVLASYLKQNMRFFVAKVNLQEQSRLGFSTLRPIQVAYESPKFMLPVRLGTVNAQGPQELIIYALTRNGRVETTNYRTVRLPSDVDVPEYVKDRFGDFYRALFSEQVRKEDMRAVFLEYFWDMSWCDPCASDPLSRDELRKLGAFWVASGTGSPDATRPRVFVTRLHLRYDGAHFPEDLVFQQTADQENFQARYVMRHPWRGASTCPEIDAYREQLRQRHQQEARALASLTGWNLETIRLAMNVGPDWAERQPPSPQWWETLWKD